MFSWLQNHMLPCAFKSLFGFECPLCGFQRSLFLLLKGQFKSSFLMYPPLLFVLLLIILSIAKLIKPGKIQSRWVAGYSSFVLVIVAVSYVVKLSAIFL